MIVYTYICVTLEGRRAAFLRGVFRNQREKKKREELSFIVMKNMIVSKMKRLKKERDELIN